MSEDDDPPKRRPRTSPIGEPPQFMRRDGELPPPVSFDPPAPIVEPVAPTPTAPVETAAVVVEEPLLPSAYSEQDLRAAIGAAPAPTMIAPPKPPKRQRPPVEELADDDDGDGAGEPKSRRLIAVAATSVVLGLAVAATIFIGRNNASRLVLTCEAKHVVAEQGRAFPPWGERRLTGDEWRPIEIPPDFICMDTEVESLKELGDLFRGKLVERADAMLVAGTDTDKAAAMLEQAMLHARTDDPLHSDARKEIKYRLGDVRYWRASGKLKEAAAALEESAKEFEAAVLEQPRYAKDSSKWAELIRRLTRELQIGPAGVARPLETLAPTEPDRAAAPPGVALPVEPSRAGSGSGSGSGSAATPAPAAPADAGVPTTGGVLL